MFTLIPVTSETIARLDQMGLEEVPPEIRTKKYEIERETRLAEQIYVTYGLVNQDHLDRIVDMKFQLDSLYTAWFQNDL